MGMKKIRILNIIHGLNKGGAESFVYNVINLLDASVYEIDIAIQNPEIKHGSIEDLMRNKGGNIHVITDFRRNLLLHIRDLHRILSSGYDYVHIHMNALVNPFPVYVASKYANKVIVHSHNTCNGSGGLLGKICHKINKHLILRRKFINIACGIDAGKWMFGNRPFTVLNNAVHLPKFTFNEAIRYQLRKKYDLKAEIVIGQVGRLADVKNHIYSFKVLKRLKEKSPDFAFKLVCVGEGELETYLKQQSDLLGISSDVIFVGGVNNPYDYYSMFDCLLLPSLFEGFAFVAVEAQASGLKVYASDCNTKDINITDAVSFFSLNDFDGCVNLLLNLQKQYDRQEISSKLIGTNFDDRVLKLKAEELYQS